MTKDAASLPPLPPIDDFVPSSGRWTTPIVIKAMHGYAEAYAREALAQQDAKAQAQIASLERVVEAQRRVMVDAVYGLSKARMWSGMDWHYNPLHALHYRPVMLALEARVNGPIPGDHPLRNIMEKLRDPVAVHAAMLRGEIAKPAIRDMLHVYGADALARWDAAEQPAAWQQIETAPKDGTVIVLARGDYAHAGHWAESRYSGMAWMSPGSDFVHAFSGINPPTRWTHMPADQAGTASAA